MTIEKVNEIFKTKYPNGKIYQKGTFGDSRFSTAVIFDEKLKAYEYNTSSYGELLARLGFTVMYQWDKENLERSIAELEKILKQGYRENILMGNIYLTDKDRESIKKQLEHKKKYLAEAILI